MQDLTSVEKNNLSEFEQYVIDCLESMELAISVAFFESGYGFDHELKYRLNDIIDNNIRHIVKFIKLKPFDNEIVEGQVFYDRLA